MVSDQRIGVLLLLALLVAGFVVGLEDSVEQETAAAVAHSCPGRCQCEMDGLLHRLDCSDLGLSDVPANLSVFTSYLPCLSLFGSWLIRSGVWLITALSLVSNGLVMLSVFLSPSSWATPPKLLIGWLALVNSLMGVWSGWLAVVDGWTFSSFWRYGVQWERSFLCRFSGFLCVFASQTGLFLLTLVALERSLASAPPAGEAPPRQTNAPPHKTIPTSRELDAHSALRPASPSPPPLILSLLCGSCAAGRGLLLVADAATPATTAATHPT
ncbi:unnamed protein product [Lota lota]